MHKQEVSLRKFEKGVSLVEVIVSIFIFSLMMISMIGIFVTILHKRADTHDMQQRTEEFSLVMSYMAKKIRTSELSPSTTCDAFTCTFRDSVLNANVSFSFDAAAHTLKEGNTVIVSNVTGRFSPITTGMPRITIQLMAVGEPDTSVQTTVSLRDY